MIQADFHLHSSFSSDCDILPEEMILAAIKYGLKKICFTDHQDFDYPDSDMTFLFDTKQYQNELIMLKDKYKDKIDILTGVELGVQPYLASRYNEYLEKYNFDFIISSSHLIYGIDPYYKEFWMERNEEDVYKKYFEEIIENVKNFTNFDVYGHIDYIVRYGPTKNQNYSYDKYKDILDAAFKTIIDAGKGIEVNTSGYRYNLGYFHPQTDLLKRYKELGGEIITIGSDAHTTEYLGYNFDKAREILLSLGFKYYTTFKDRKPTFNPL